MMRAALAALMLSVPAAGGVAEASGVPSGLTYSLLEVLYEPQGASYESARRTVRLRLVAPELADSESYGFDRIEGDFQALCDTLGLETVAKSAPNARQIVISVSAEPVAFGDSVPNVTQYFDLFKVEENTCIWEGI